MADNVTAPAAGVVFATDEIGTAPNNVHWPYAKLAFGADGSAVAVADSNGARLPVTVGGAVAVTGTFWQATQPVSAASLPLPTGAATAAAQATGNASLGSIDGKLPALSGGLLPVSVPVTATTTRAYAYAAGQRLTTSGAAAVRSAAITATEVLLHASVRGFVRIGDAAVTAAVAAGSIPIAPDEKFHLRITSGEFVSFIRDGATDASLTIMPIAA